MTEDVNFNNENKREIVMLPVDCLFPHPDNPRKNLGDLTELTDSLKANGVLQNLTVVPDESGPADAPRFIVIIGHRRLAAAKLAGLTELPCVIADRMTPAEQVAIMLTENIQRSALTPYEEAKGFEQLRIDFGKSVKEIVKLSGFSETTVRNRLKLTKLDADKFNASLMRGGRMEDYLELDNIRDPDLRNQLLDQIGTNNFRNALKSAIKREKSQSTLERWEKEASAFAERIDETDSSGKTFVYYYTARGDQSQTIKRPDDGGKSKYYYTVDFDTFSLTLYRNKTKRDRDEKAAQKAEEQEKRAAYDAKKARFEEIAKRHKELRKEFAVNYKARGAAPIIMQCAMYIIIGDGQTTRFGHHYDINLLMELLKLDARIDFENDNWGDALRVFREFIQDEVQDLRGVNEILLFCVIYAELDGWTQNGRYWGEYWDSDKKEWHISYEENPKLDRLYDLLTNLGYEMSDEEIQMRNGTHPLFDSVKN